MNSNKNSFCPTFDKSRLKNYSILYIDEYRMYKEYIELYTTYTQKYGVKTAIFLMVGSFYELYDIQNPETGETECNVREIVDILGIQLSVKREGEQQCLFAGFPDYVMHKWAGRLTSIGWTVVIVDQIKDMKGKVKERKVSRILSPSTHIENIAANETAYIITLFMEQKSDRAPEIGAAALDLTTGKTLTFSCIASGRADIWTADDLVQMLHIYQPKELVIFWKGLCVPEEQLFRKLITTTAPIHIRQVDTIGAFNHALVRTEYLQKLYTIKSLLPIRTYLGLRSDQEELALLYLLQFTEEHYASMLKSLHRNIPWVPNSKLVCGNHALSQLQMTQTDGNGILGLFTRCITAMGKRGIRERLLSPYSNAQQIRIRLEEVNEYLSWDHQKVTHLERQFRFMYDLPRLHRKIICANITSEEIGGLFQSYHAIQNLMNITKESCLKQTYTDDEWTEYMTAFTTQFTENKPQHATPFNTETYPEIGEKEQEIQRILEQLEVLRTDFNALLKDDAVRIEEREKEPFGFKTSTIMLKQLKKCSNLPEGTVITELKSGGWISCTKLQELNKQMIQRREQLQHLSYKAQLVACESIASTHILSTLEEWVCHLDCTQCIGYTSRQHAWSCPTILDLQDNEGSGFDIKQIRHPLVEASATRISYVKHDIALGMQHPGEEKNGWLVYGMNASGKSTLMKATGICILLAQAGCYVPAKEMTLKPFQAIYTRILNQDNIHAGLSSFAVEMSELRDILRNATPYTMVLGDELCAGTESISAQALVASGIQWLSEKHAKFIFATHLHDLPNLVKNVEVWHLHVDYDPVTKKLTYDRSLRPGSGSSLYGLEVARAMDLPFEFIEQALKNREQMIGSIKMDAAKSSSWNREIVRKECEICKKQIVSELEVHHISPRASAVNQRLANGTHMNDKRNLIVICQTCHDAVHAEKIEIGELQMTSDGPQRIITEVLEVAETPKRKGKWSDEEVELMMKMLRTYSSLSIKAIRGKLSQIHSIEISDAALGKFRKMI